MIAFHLPLNPKFSDLANLFLQWSEEIHDKKTTGAYRHYFQSFEKSVGNVELSEIVPARLKLWAKTWHRAAAVKRLFAWGHVEARVIASNPVDQFPLPTRGKRRRVASRGEVALMLRRSRRDLRELLIAYRETFARPGEMRRVQWEDLRFTEATKTPEENLADGNAYLLLHEFKDATKRIHADAVRVILISPRLGRLMIRLRRVSPGASGVIFQTRRGKTWTPNALRCRMRRLRARSGIVRDGRGETIVPYTFRHTGATICAAAGVRDRQLADLLGHVETRTTARYVHLSPDDLRRGLFTAGIWGRRKM